MPVLLVRHACAGERGAWPGTDDQRPLDEKGRAQALALVPLLRSYDPARICSSPATRCIQTVAPTAEALGVELEVVDALYEGDSADAIALVRSLAGGETVVLCSHGDVVPDVLDALSVDGMAGWFGATRCQKGSVWALHPNGNGFEKAIYHPPPT